MQNRANGEAQKENENRQIPCDRSCGANQRCNNARCQQLHIQAVQHEPSQWQPQYSTTAAPAQSTATSAAGKQCDNRTLAAIEVSTAGDVDRHRSAAMVAVAAMPAMKLTMVLWSADDTWPPNSSKLHCSTAHSSKTVGSLSTPAVHNSGTSSTHNNSASRTPSGTADATHGSSNSSTYNGRLYAGSSVVSARYWLGSAGALRTSGYRQRAREQ